MLLWLMAVVGVVVLVQHHLVATVALVEPDRVLMQRLPAGQEIPHQLHRVREIAAQAMLALQEARFQRVVVAVLMQQAIRRLLLVLLALAVLERLPLSQELLRHTLVVVVEALREEQRALVAQVVAVLDLQVSQTSMGLTLLLLIEGLVAVVAQEAVMVGQDHPVS
jgi:hypothetical protein